MCLIFFQSRKPFSAQKTVRELLHQNGIEPKDNSAIRLSNDQKENRIRHSSESEARKSVGNMGNGTQIVKSEPDAIRPHPGLPSPSDVKPIPAAFMPVLSQAHPMFYPHLVPMGAPMPTMGVPFMFPSFGYQSINTSVQSLPASVRNPVSIKDEKPPGMASNKLSLSSQSSMASLSSSYTTAGKSAMSHPHLAMSRSMGSPPSAHSSTVKASTPIPVAHGSSHTLPAHHRPITPAHSNHNKRQYPYPESNKNMHHQVSASSSGGRDLDTKRQKGHSPHMAAQQSSPSAQDISVLDLSMKTMKAQETRHKHGESLLFDASFTREGKFNLKSEHFDAPEDLSKKSPLNLMEKVKERKESSHKSVPLNVPLPVQSNNPYIKKEESVKTEVGQFVIQLIVEPGY